MLTEDSYCPTGRTAKEVRKQQSAYGDASEDSGNDEVSTLTLTITFFNVNDIVNVDEGRVLVLDNYNQIIWMTIRRG